LKSLIIISATFSAFFQLSCGEKKEDRTFRIFNEGISLNLNSIQEQNKGNFKQAVSLN
jgi:hypothetical protein